MTELTLEEKRDMIKRYEPILYFHPDEQFSPIKPEEYIQHCALWHSQPVSSDKRDWGNKPDTGDFPRTPLIPRDCISINPHDDLEGAPDNNSVKKWYMGHVTPGGSRRPYLVSDEFRELFLDFGGWKGDGDLVNANTKNESSDKEAIIERISEPWIKDANYWYYAEVDPVSSLTNLIYRINEIENADLNLDWILETFKEPYIIWYYFFYPYHEETTRKCVGDAGHSTDGSYEGDWAAIAVFVVNDVPQYVLTSIKERGMKEIPDFLKQQVSVVAWEDTRHEHEHVKIYVAKNSHNNYHIPGPEAPPSTITNFICGALSETMEEVQTVTGEVENAGAAIITAGKIVTGCAVGLYLGGLYGFAIGCIAGGAAALIEAIVDYSDDSSESVDQRAEQEAARDYPPDEYNYGTIISPTEYASTLLELERRYAEIENYEKEVIVKEVVSWTEVPELPEAKLINRDLQVWWKYEGRWGVRVQKDNFDRRGGTKFLDFKEQFFYAFCIYLSEE